MDFAPVGNGRLVVSLAALAALAAAVFFTMDPGKPRALTWVLLGFFAFRILLRKFAQRPGVSR